MAEKITEAKTGKTVSKTITEFVILIRNPKTNTLHALLNPRAGQGALAVFESPEFAVSQTENLAMLKGREYFILPVE